MPVMDIVETVNYFIKEKLGDENTIRLFNQRISKGAPFTKQEGSDQHINVFFLPYDQKNNSICLGHHKKADDWIPPGGHIDRNESPIKAAIREISEELRVKATKDQLEPFALSVKDINRPKQNCIIHYDIWYLFHTPITKFDYLKNEYYDVSWFSIKEGIRKIKKNPDFSQIIAKLIHGKNI